MTKLIGKTHYGIAVGIITGLFIYSLNVLYENKTKLSLMETETVIEVEVLEQLIQETDCVEIIEYDMSTGMKTTIGCASKEST